ncbi:MAG: excisionase [Oscillospiraceae bacterium]|nr:excisionase [Oscillospiraceae bacterium]
MINVNYILTHRKTAVAEIEINPKRANITAVGRVINANHLPVGITVVNNIPDIDDLNDWWQGRSIPASRQNFLRAMENMDVSSSQELILKCLGLSLSDQYWVNPVQNQLRWEDINFFDNPFSEDVGNALFCETMNSRPLDLLAPDNTSDGWLKKRWKIIDGKRCLIKGGSDPFHQEPCNEAIATAIMQRLKINHIPYRVSIQKGLPYSICENFITSDTELVSGFYIHNTRRIKNPNDFYTHFLECCNELKIPNAQEDFDKMLTLDYLIANKDRHMSNFGAVRNAQTLEWTGLAPVYDSGTSLWHNKLDIDPKTAPCSKPFLGTHEEQIKSVKDFSWFDPSLLSGIRDDFYNILSLSPHINEQRIHSIWNAFKTRVDMIMC